MPLDAGLNGKGFFAFTQRLPLGVVAAITPFNYPLNLTIHKIAPAIACKNTVIVKPPTEAPLTVMKFCDLLNDEFPDGVVNVVTGTPPPPPPPKQTEPEPVVPITEEAGALDELLNFAQGLDNVTVQ